MANSNFVVHNGLTVGGTVVNATTGNVTMPTSSSILIGSVLLKDNGAGGLALRDPSDNSDAALTATLTATSTTQGNIQIGTNHIETVNTNGQLSIRPNGTGALWFSSNTFDLGRGGDVTIGTAGAAGFAAGNIQLSPGGSKMTVVNSNFKVTGTVEVASDLAVNGGDITTTATTVTHYNTNATTASAYGAAAALTLGATTGTMTLRNPTIVGSQTTQNLFNTVATTLNIGGAATALSLGATTGTTTIRNALTVTGNLTVNGTTTTVNATTLTIDDKNIEMGSVASPTDVTADGGGITLKGATDKTILWSTTGWTSSEDWNLATGKQYEINGTAVLSATTLGSGVTASSLTSVGTITSGTWSATDIAVAHGGTGASDAATARTNLGLAIGTNVQAYNATLAAVAGGTYTGDDSITTVGTIATGTWNATTIAVAKGGTGVTTSTGTGSVVLSTSPTFTTQITTPVIAHSGTNGVGDIGQVGSTFATVYATTFSGVSTTAKYADLAENYQADSQYEPGTVVEFGGAHEVTVATEGTKRIAGVVSTNPAHLMNGSLSGQNVVALALQGRVPCRVIGPVAKGDLMVSAGFGYAKANNDAATGQVIGKALADFTGAKGVIEVVVGRV